MFSFLAEFKTAKKIVSQRFHVIFFAENRFYFQYFRHLFESLVNEPGIRIAYITSDPKDERLQDERIQAFYIRHTLAGVFSKLRADVMIMTMPDLQNFIFKRSPEVKKYVYVFHAMVSTHQQYRKGAFDHYDAVFCTGPQQEEEIRQAEKKYALPAKDIIHYGYPLLRELKEKAAQQPAQKKILVAPSWYKEGIFQQCILPLTASLAETGYETWIRPHPEFVKRNRQVYKKLLQQLRSASNVFFDESPSVYAQLADAAYLVTDRSGIAFEFAFATDRPVLFVDTPLKIQNPEVKEIPIEPLENRYRSHIGRGIAPSGVQNAGQELKVLSDKKEDYVASIKRAEEAIVFPETFWQNGVSYLLGRLSG